MPSWLKTESRVAQNDRRANAHHHKQILCYFELASPFYGRFSVQKWPFSACFEAVFRTIVLKIQDDRQCANQVSQMQHCRLPPSSVLVEVLIVWLILVIGVCATYFPPSLLALSTKKEGHFYGRF